jgi:LysM domain
MGGREVKKRALGIPTLFVAALALGAGAFFVAERSYDAPNPQVESGRTSSNLDQSTPATISPEGVPAKSTKKNSKRISELSENQPGDNPSVITLESGQTLSELSLRYLGRFNDEITQQIQKLNPEIKNPDVVYAGTQVRLPTPPGAFDRSASNSNTDPSPEEHTR